MRVLIINYLCDRCFLSLCKESSSKKKRNITARYFTSGKQIETSLDLFFLNFVGCWIFVGGVFVLFVFFCKGTENCCVMMEYLAHITQHHSYSGI